MTTLFDQNHHRNIRARHCSVCESGFEGRVWGYVCLLLFASLFLIGCGPKLETVQQNGEEFQAYWDKDQDRYVPHGTFKAFYESGTIKSVGQYEHGNKTGIWMQYYDNGQKQSEMDWVNGKPEGVVTEWYENGQIKNEGHWKNGGRHGLSVWWYPDGTKAKEVTYMDGEPNGTWTYWDSVGVVNKQQFWERGKFLRVIPPDSVALSPVK